MPDAFSLSVPSPKHGECGRQPDADRAAALPLLEERPILSGDRKFLSESDEAQDFCES